jgi:PPOX class probable F420-dependent enzyme
MTNDAFPDPTTPFGKRVQERLRDDIVIWLTTVGADGTPQPNPVWFLAEGDTVLVYNRDDAHRLKHVRRNPRVTLNFDGDGEGGDIIVLSGNAEVVQGYPLASDLPAYMDKYEELARRISGDPTAFAEEYSVALMVRIDRVRGFLT